MSSSKKLVVKFFDDEQKEMIMAWASMHEPDAMVEHSDTIDIFLTDENYAELESTLQEKLNLPSEAIAIEEVELKNWNEDWEANFKPIEVGNIYIRAEFHPPSEAHDIDLIISPKMAFGTGHHETTYMMLDHMNTLNMKGQSVLDYGCGTGILTVFAKMKGCGSITGIDIQEEAVENTVEHFELNKISTEDLKVQQGDLNVLAHLQYDVILANINRHVLLQNAANLFDRLSPKGQLLMSGILITDRELILKEYTSKGFNLLSEDQRGEWCRFSFGKE